MMITLQFNMVAALLVLLIVLGLLTHNSGLTISACALLIMQQTALGKSALPWFAQHGLYIGVIILTIGVLSPLVMGKVTLPAWSQLWQSPALWLAIAVGMLVAWLGAQGAGLMSAQPTLVTGLLLGTLLGVTLFKGVPVGPLIAAGILSAVLSLGQWLK